MKYTIISKKIREYREKHQLTPEQLHRKLSISASLIKSFEVGDRVPSSEIKLKLCNIFGISVDELEGIPEKEVLKNEITSLIHNYKLNSEDLIRIKNNLLNFFGNLEDLARFIIITHRKSFDISYTWFNIDSLENLTRLEEYKNSIINDKTQIEYYTKLINTSPEKLIIHTIFEFFYNRFIITNYFKIKSFQEELATSDLLLQIVVDNSSLIETAIKELTLKNNEANTKIPVVTKLFLDEETNINNAITFIEISKPFLKGNKYVAYKVTDDSMFPRYMKEEIAIILLTNDYKSDLDVMVSINNHSPILRRIYVSQNGNITLQPLNPIYRPDVYTKADVKKLNIQIVGIVTQIILNN